MSRNLIKAGYSLTVYDINESAVKELEEAGAAAAASPAEVERQCDIIITMLPNSPHVKSVVMEEGGVLEGAKPGTVLIDMSSIAPLASKEINAACLLKGVDMFCLLYTSRCV